MEPLKMSEMTLRKGCSFRLRLPALNTWAGGTARD